MGLVRNPLLATPGRPMPSRVAIVGAGTIGPDIGYYLKSALPALELVLVDISQPALDRALARFDSYARKAVDKKKMKPEDAAAVTRGITASTDYAALRGADWVLEAATEDLALKRRIFAQVEALISPQALITSNTSSLPAARVFSELRDKSRATVTHFFAPAWRNPIVEVVGGYETDPAVVQWLRWFFCATGKVPLVTADVECFMLDRVFDNWCNDAALCLERATAAQVDAVAEEFV
ncbi:MAG TPA: 3-hydroxyacyl-CoA dehydrogenase family protein, partial [Burkholderiales bacterium]